MQVPHVLDIIDIHGILSGVCPIGTDCESVFITVVLLYLSEGVQPKHSYKMAVLFSDQICCFAFLTHTGWMHWHGYDVCAIC